MNWIYVIVLIFSALAIIEIFWRLKTSRSQLDAMEKVSHKISELPDSIAAFINSQDERSQKTSEDIARAMDVLVKSTDRQNEQFVELSEKLTGALTQASTEMSEALTGSMAENVNDMVTQFADHSKTLLDKLESNLHDLPGAMKENAETIGAHTLKTLDSITDFTRDLKEREETLLKENVETIGAHATKTLDSITAFTRDLKEREENLIKGNSDGLKQIVEGQKEEIQAVINSQQSMIDSMLDRLQDASARSLDNFSEGTKELFGHVSQLVKELNESLLTSQQALTTEIKTVNDGLVNAVSSKLEIFGELQKESSQLIEKASGNFSQSGQLLEEAGQLSHVNQAGLQANIEMLNTGLTQIMGKLDKKTEEKENEDDFIRRLHGTLEAFQEKATEILIENSVKTREILLGKELEQS
ncbi:MAG: hypothetical protein HQK83_11670 [Fibrobacteria bacterium]|nr:hypothetical protein [Fibrobacteria bacterium]